VPPASGMRKGVITKLDAAEPNLSEINNPKYRFQNSSDSFSWAPYQLS